MLGPLAVAVKLEQHAGYSEQVEQLVEAIAGRDWLAYQSDLFHRQDPAKFTAATASNFLPNTGAGGTGAFARQPTSPTGLQVQQMQAAVAAGYPPHPYGLYGSPLGPRQTFNALSDPDEFYDPSCPTRCCCCCCMNWCPTPTKTLVKRTWYMIRPLIKYLAMFVVSIWIIQLLNYMVTGNRNMDNLIAPIRRFAGYKNDETAKASDHPLRAETPTATTMEGKAKGEDPPIPSRRPKASPLRSSMTRIVEEEPDSPSSSASETTTTHTASTGRKQRAQKAKENHSAQAAAIALQDDDDDEPMRGVR
jgi:hypothetical protein